jgi:predicted Fe-Mo cluster-binding NifX family protein
MKIAIPTYKDDIAPCFEAACYFLIVATDGRRETSAKIVQCSDSGGIGRVRFLRDNDITTLICNGIKGHFRGMLQAAGVAVISNIGYPAREALDLYMNGKFGDRPEKILPSDYACGILLEDLICWTKDLFESSGYTIKCGTDTGPFPIDLIAEIPCPVCLNPIRVAICCGAHMYRPDKEIREFYHAAGSNYHVRVYVHPENSEMKSCCHEFGIELLDPYTDPSASSKSFASGLPLLQGVIEGHEKAAKVKQ